MAAILMALLSALLFATATPLSKLLLKDLSAFQLAGLLYLGGAVGVMPLVLHRNQQLSIRRMNRKNQLRLIGAALLGGIAGPVFLLMGLNFASAASVSLWLNLELVFTALLGRLIFNDHLGRFGWIGIAGTIAAGILLTVEQGTTGVLAGSLVTLACLCWGFDNHFTALIDGISPAYSTFVKGIFAGSTNLVIGIATQPLPAEPAAIAGGLVLGAFAYGASIALYIAAAQKLGATRGQSLFATAPFIGVLLSVLILGEGLSAFQIIAAFLLVGALVVMFRDRHAHEHSHEQLVHAHSHSHDDLHHAHDHDFPAPAGQHSHAHEHTPVVHSHPHWPDLHHRHNHKPTNEQEPR
jgi:drug/metabolite transporter (DMT)-like permease